MKDQGMEILTAGVAVVVALAGVVAAQRDDEGGAP